MTAFSQVSEARNEARKPRGRINIESRPGTQDAHAFREVFVQNCYKLPQWLGRRDVILDIGAHIGCFSIACLIRGASTIWAFEPDLENHHLLEKNLHQYFGTHVFRKAIWRSDRHDPLYFSGYPENMNACGTCLPLATVGGMNVREPVESIGLDEAIRLASEDGKRRIRLLKIDAEGAEFPALATCTKLDLVDEIVGECHEIGDLGGMLPGLPWFSKYTMDELAEFLKKQGFAVETKAMKPNPLHLFFAKRKV